MATAPQSRRLNLTRDQLATFLTDQQQIRQFELLFSTVDELQVITGTDFEYQADTAAANANNALAQISALAQDTAVDDAVLNAKVQQALDAIPRLAQALDLLALAPLFDFGLVDAAIRALKTAPVTKTANFTVAANETWLINNKSGSSCTVTLPTASTNTGRTLHFQNYQAQTLVSASSNVVPLAGGSATTAILEAVAGANATLVSDGTNWIMTQYDSNNALQLE
jgi:hypothetical protein